MKVSDYYTNNTEQFAKSCNKRSSLCVEEMLRKTWFTLSWRVTVCSQKRWYLHVTCEGMVGRIMPSKENYTLVPGTCEWVILRGKEKLRVKMKWRLVIQLTLRWGENLVLWVSPMSAQGSLRVGAENESVSEWWAIRLILLNLKMEEEVEMTSVGSL